MRRLLLVLAAMTAVAAARAADGDVCGLWLFDPQELSADGGMGTVPNRIPESIVQGDLDERHRVPAEDDFIFSAEKEDELIEVEEDEAPNAGGKMIGPDSKEWSDEYWETDYQDENDDFQVVSDPDEEQVF